MSFSKGNKKQTCKVDLLKLVLNGLLTFNFYGIKLPLTFCFHLYGKQLFAWRDSIKQLKLNEDFSSICGVFNLWGFPLTSRGLVPVAIFCYTSCIIKQLKTETRLALHRFYKDLWEE